MPDNLQENKQNKKQQHNHLFIGMLVLVYHKKDITALHFYEYFVKPASMENTQLRQLNHIAEWNFSVILLFFFSTIFLLILQGYNRVNM